MSNNVHEHACRCCREGLCIKECECYWFNKPHHLATKLEAAPDTLIAELAEKHYDYVSMTGGGSLPWKDLREEVKQRWRDEVAYILSCFRDAVKQG